MQIRHRLALHLVIQLALLAALMFSLVHLARTYRDLEGAESRRMRAQRLVAEFYQSTDALSLMARLYVVRPDPRFTQFYDEADSIREGRSPQPSGYESGYWDLRLIGSGDAAAAVGAKAPALLPRLREAGVSEQELSMLEEAKRQSQLLMAIERRAMRLAATGGGAAQHEALELVHGESYLRARAGIMAPMRRMLEALDQRLEEERTRDFAELRRAAYQVVALMLLLISHALLSAWSFYSEVRRPLAVLRGWADAVRAGLLSSRTRLPQGNEFGELSGAIDEMAESVERHLAELREEVQRRTRAEEVVQNLANHDALTGLPSLRLLHDRLDRALARAEREREGLALLFIDLNGFKPVNDCYGHEAGDMVLKMVGQRLSGGLRESDTVGRVGGDEFVALLGDVAERGAAEQVRRKLDVLMRQPIYLPSHKVVVQISAAIGVSIYPADAKDAAGLLRLADQDMYMQKAAQKTAARPEPPPVSLSS